MPEFKRVRDPFQELRSNLFGNTEPTVTLTGCTFPVGFIERDPVVSGESSTLPGIERVSGAGVSQFRNVETLPAQVAAISYGRAGTIRTDEDYDRAVSLNKTLIRKNHLTPLEAVQFQFKITGLSKAAGAQLSRYRHSGHISLSRRFTQQGENFVYPILSDMTRSGAEAVYNELEKIFRSSIETYNLLRSYGATREVARLCIPVASATQRNMWVNARSLRHMFNERLRADTESELRRLMWLIWDILIPLTPSLFEDLVDAADR